MPIWSVGGFVTPVNKTNSAPVAPKDGDAEIELDGDPEIEPEIEVDGDPETDPEIEVDGDADPWDADGDPEIEPEIDVEGD